MRGYPLEVVATDFPLVAEFWIFELWLVYQLCALAGYFGS